MERERVEWSSEVSHDGRGHRWERFQRQEVLNLTEGKEGGEGEVPYWEAFTRVQPSPALPLVAAPGNVACMMESTRARELKGSRLMLAKTGTQRRLRMKQAYSTQPRAWGGVRAE